jgi:hypothetical protein
MNNKKSENTKYLFWLDNIEILYKDNQYLNFIPSQSMTKVEQLNSITRFCIYYIVLLLLFNKSVTMIYFPIFIIILIILLYKIYDIDESGKLTELKKNIKNDESFENIKNDKSFENYKNEEGFENSKYDEDDINDIKLETGYNDFNGKIQINSLNKIPKYERIKKPLPYSYDKYDEFKKNTCQRPTVDNPFMNPLINDYGTKNTTVACNVDDAEIDLSIKDNFNKNLYRDIGSVWERENSQRLFYTIPNTQIPNQQTEFAEWLYKTPYTCKEDQHTCLKYEDIRFKK